MHLPAGITVASGERLVVCDSVDGLAVQAASFLAAHLRRLTAAGGVASVALAGGSTPLPTYRQLAAASLPWSRVTLLLGDERLVPAGHADSNGFRIRSVLQAGAVAASSPAAGKTEPGTGEEDEITTEAAPVTRLVPMLPADAHLGAEGQAAQMAAAYAAQMEAAVRRWRGDVPVLDVAILGLGADGHIASLFPGSPALEERRQTVVVAPGPPGASGSSPPVPRLTLTVPVFEAADCLVFLVAGGGKAGVLGRALAGDISLPAGRLCRRPKRTIWFTDREAAAALDVSPPG